MSKKKKKVIWHKKQGKFIPSSLLKSRDPSSSNPSSCQDSGQVSRKIAFKKKLTEQIKRAAKSA